MGGAGATLARRVRRSPAHHDALCRTAAMRMHEAATAISTGACPGFSPAPATECELFGQFEPRVQGTGGTGSRRMRCSDDQEDADEQPGKCRWHRHTAGSEQGVGSRGQILDCFVGCQGWEPVAGCDKCWRDARRVLRLNYRFWFQFPHKHKLLGAAAMSAESFRIMNPRVPMWLRLWWVMPIRQAFHLWALQPTEDYDADFQELIGQEIVLDWQDLHRQQHYTKQENRDRERKRRKRRRLQRLIACAASEKDTAAKVVVLQDETMTAGQAQEEQHCVQPRLPAVQQDCELKEQVLVLALAMCIALILSDGHCQWAHFQKENWNGNVYECKNIQHFPTTLIVILIWKNFECNRYFGPVEKVILLHGGRHDP